MRLGVRRFGRVVVGAAVGAVSVASSVWAPSHAAAPVRAAASTTQAAPQVVQVDYGDIVTVPSTGLTGAVTLRFVGRRGKRVALTNDHYDDSCQRATLSMRGHRVSRDALGFWRLPRTGTYELDFSHRCIQVSPGGATYAVSVAIAVHRLAVHRGEVGPWLDTRSAGPTMHAYRVSVPRGAGGVSIEGTGEARHLRPVVARASRLTKPWSARTAGREWCRPSLVLTSVAVGTAPHRWECPWTMRRSDDYLVTSDAPVRIRPFASSSAPVGGAAATWTGDDPRIVTFRAEAGSYVRLSATNLDLEPPPAVPDDWVSPPAYRTFGKSLTYAAGFFDADSRVHHLVLQVTRSGLQSINLHEARARDAGARTSVRVRSVSHTAVHPGVATPLPIEGNRWTLATIPSLPDAAPYAFEARVSVLSTSGVAEGWTAHQIGLQRRSGSAADASRRVAALTAPGTSDWVLTTSHELNGVLVTPGPGSTSGTITAQVETR